MRIYEYISYQMSLKSLRKVAQELQGGYMRTSLTKCLLKASEKQTRNSRIIYEYIPYQSHSTCNVLSPSEATCQVWNTKLLIMIKNATLSSKVLGFDQQVFDKDNKMQHLSIKMLCFEVHEKEILIQCCFKQGAASTGCSRISSQTHCVKGLDAL